MSKPFSDIKFCSTSISSEVRSDIANKIKAMGGTHSSNLMSDVTVLIVGDRNTEKYRFSVRNRSDVKFVAPEAITTIHSNWIKNLDKIDPNILNIDNYTLPIFSGFQICLSRVLTDEHFDAANKFELIKIIQENGGEVSDSLTQASSIVLTNQKSGKRYESAKKWGVPSIHPLWIIHSVERKAALDIQYYDIDKVEDVKSIGESSCMVWNDLKKKKNKRPRAVPDDEEQIRKKPEIWKSIMDDAKKQALVAKKTDDAWDEAHLDEGDDFDKIRKMEELNPKRKPLSFTTIEVDSNLFTNKTFVIERFSPEKKAILTKTIKSHSGKVFDSFDPDSPPNYLLIPSELATIEIPSYYFDVPDTEILTEFFVERCLHYREIRLDTWGKPFYQPLTDSPTLNICITGFQGIELTHLERMISLSGFNYHTTLNKDRDILIVNFDILRSKAGEHLICKYPTLFDDGFKKKVPQTVIQSTKNKIDFAKKHQIPIVTLVYMFESFYSGFAYNVNGRECCIHCPKFINLKPHLRPLTYSDSNARSGAPRMDSSSSLPKLPSPIRNKRNDKWGRLVGRAPVSEIAEPIRLESVPGLDPTANEEISSTQIGYGGTQLNDKLRSLLNNDGGEKMKKSDEDDTTAPATGRTRTTRQGFRDMLNIMGHED